MLRQIGDKVLHSVAAKIDFDDQNMIKEFALQINILQAKLQAIGIIGIAANQCKEIAEPLRIMIIGTNHEEFRKKAAERYLGQQMPYETIMLNPVILRYFGEKYFPITGEGCGSVHCSLRARIQRFKSIEIQYYDVNRQLHQEILHDIGAHIIQHEIEHLDGIVYLQKIFKEMSKPELAQFAAIVDRIITTATYAKKTDEASELRHLVFERGVNGELEYSTESLENALKTASLETLEGILERIKIS